MSPGSVVLSSEVRAHRLVATAFDADGQEVEASVTWQSSDPAKIVVDRDGSVKATTDIGSALVRAEAQGIRSAPAMVASVQLRPGSVLVSDADVVSVGTYDVPAGSTPGAEPVAEIRLRNVAPPPPGTVVVASESAAIAGIVVSARVEGNETIVRLRSISVPELFDRYDFAWQFDLADYPIVMDEQPAERLAPDQSAAGGRPRAETKIEIEFPPSRSSSARCVGSASAHISSNLFSLKLVGDARFVYESRKDDPSLPADYLKVAVVGPLALAGTIGIKAEAGFAASATCEFKGRFPIPLLGWLSALIAPAIPLGIGVALDGKLTIASLQLGLEGRIGYDVDMGVECGPGDAPCHFLDKLEPIMELAPKVTVPSLSGMKVDLSATTYFITGLDVLVLGGLYQGEIAKATLGPVQDAHLAFVDTQADERGYASTYELSLKGGLVPGSTINNAIEKLMNKDVATLGASIEISKQISQSPRGTMEVDRTRIQPNKQVHFTFRLAPETVNYFALGYNVESIEVYRKRDDRPGYEHVASVPVAASIQSTFSWDWKPTSDDTGQNEFFAFVKTKMPVIQLEIAPDSSRKVEVLSLCAPDPEARSLAEVLREASGCEVLGTVKHTATERQMVDGVLIGSMTTISEGTVDLTEDPSQETHGILVFRATGMFHSEQSGTSTACTLTSDPVSGTTVGGQLVVYTDLQSLYPPYLYTGLIDTGSFDRTTTWACPDLPPLVMTSPTTEDLFSVDAAQNLIVDIDHKTVQGSYTESVEMGESFRRNTFEWNLLLRPASE